MKRILTILLFISAVALSISAEYFSIFGLSQVFAGKAMHVIVLACAFGLAKLTITGFLHEYWNSFTTRFWKVFKFVFLIFTGVLIVLTSAGVFGFLSDAYQETADRNTINEQKIELLQNQKKRFETRVVEWSSDKESVLQNIKNLTASISTNRQSQWKDRETGEILTSIRKMDNPEVTKQLDIANARKDTLEKRIDSYRDSIQIYEIRIIEANQSNEASSELRILRHLVNITGYPMDKVSTWYIFILVIVADPLAIALLIAALHTLKTGKIVEDEQILEAPKAVSEPTTENQVLPKEPPKEEPKNPKALIQDKPKKRKRGRPRKHPLPDPDKPKRKRGRPKGSKNKKKVQPQVLNAIHPEPADRKVAESGLTEATARQLADSVSKKKKINTTTDKDDATSTDPRVV